MPRFTIPAAKQALVQQPANVFDALLQHLDKKTDRTQGAQKLTMLLNKQNIRAARMNSGCFLYYFSYLSFKRSF